LTLFCAKYSLICTYQASEALIKINGVLPP